ncbi:hypothetical protein H072_1942 [Dactylellina haptotyla CBS 200.50]|uniref:N-acetyltransferase domain-containing protein n=1 Tax=Dactylellina haptotyla (strain CBS 200.50) TaxID=1284197 RepID=S8ASR6_DACHA|nr:hypothetical protein H072_1942 [Dactylellina haptotyla CBS 200.50]
MAKPTDNTAGLEITRLAVNDIDHAIKTIQLAFADDPFAAWIYDRSKFSPKRNHASLTIRMKWGMRNGHIYVAHTPEKRCAGVAMWVGPKPLDQKPTWDDWWQDWALWFRQLGMNTRFGRGGLKTKRYYLWKECQSKMQSQVWTNPEGYWFCNILTIHPECQGKGIGKALMKVVFDQADADGVPCYLESSKFEPNVKIYEKMGFSFVKDIKCDDGEAACTLFSMIRDAPGKSTDEGEAEEDAAKDADTVAA